MGNEDRRISLNLLGPFLLQVDGRERPRLPGKAQALLAMLALRNGRPVARGTIADMLWTCGAREEAHRGLRQVLLAIRRQVGPGVVHEAGGMLILPHDGVTIDVPAFEALVASADRAELARCVALYRGELLENVATIAPRFDEWLAVERIRLAEIATEAMRHLALSHLEAGEFDAAVATARRIVALDELRLDAHHLLVAILGRCGRRAEALHHYELCEEVLSHELDIVADDETLTLVARLRAGAQLSATPGQTGRRNPR